MGGPGDGIPVALLSQILQGPGPQMGGPPQMGPVGGNDMTGLGDGGEGNEAQLEQLIQLILMSQQQGPPPGMGPGGPPMGGPPGMAPGGPPRGGPPMGGPPGGGNPMMAAMGRQGGPPGPPMR